MKVEHRLNQFMHMNLASVEYVHSHDEWKKKQNWLKINKFANHVSLFALN